jgi:hypothetical protein
VNWQSPQYQELKMDAEIGSYQPDGDVPPDGYFTRPDERGSVADRPARVAD